MNLITIEAEPEDAGEHVTFTESVDSEEKIERWLREMLTKQAGLKLQVKECSISTIQSVYNLALEHNYQISTRAIPEKTASAEFWLRPVKKREANGKGAARFCSGEKV